MRLDGPKIVCAQPGSVAAGRDANGNTITINGNAQIATGAAVRQGWQATIGLTLIALALPSAAARAARMPPWRRALQRGRRARRQQQYAVLQFRLDARATQAVTEAAVKGATGPLVDRTSRTISKTLGVTEDAAKTLLKIVGEDPNIPDDKLAEALTKSRRRLQEAAGAGRGAEPGQSDGESARRTGQARDRRRAFRPRS